LLAGLAVAAGAAAIALGTWAFISNTRSSDPGTARSSRAGAMTASAMSFLSRPGTRRIVVAGSRGRITLAVGAHDRGILVLSGLRSAPFGKSYQAWVLGPSAKKPVSAALFSGSAQVVRLGVPVRPRSIVSITLERAGGVALPTRKAVLVARLNRGK
jgi:hypothetical protein